MSENLLNAPRIWADVNNTLISKFYSPLIKTVPSTPFTSGITTIFMFQFFFIVLCAERAKSTIQHVLFFFWGGYYHLVWFSGTD